MDGFEVKAHTEYTLVKIVSRAKKKECDVD